MKSNGVYIPESEKELVQQVFSDYLSCNRIALKADFAAAVAERGIIMDDHRLSYHIRFAEYSGLICSGDLFPMKHSYALAEKMLPAVKSLSKDEALALLVRKYFRSHGPATLEDFLWWSGLNISDCKEGIYSIQSELITERWKGLSFFRHPDYRHHAHDQKGIFWPVILQDGEVVGNWSAGNGRVETNVFHPEADVDETALREETYRYLKFMRTAQF